MENIRVNYLPVLGTIMTGFLLSNCSSGHAQRPLAVGGIHVFDGQTPCKLLRVEPEIAVKDLRWVDTLALEARSEGNAKVMCGSEKIVLKAVAPARLEIKLVSDGKPTAIIVHERFNVQAWLCDRPGRELEVGKFTNFQWTCSGILEVANDRSSGEFGFCDTCFGLQHFRAIESGSGLIIVRFGGLEGKLMIEPIPEEKQPIRSRHRGLAKTFES